MESERIIPKYKIGDTIQWLCEEDQRIHEAKVEFVNFAGAGYPDINYEVTDYFNGEKKTTFVDEYDVISSV